MSSPNKDVPKKRKWEWTGPKPVVIPDAISQPNITEAEIDYRLRGYLDCLRALSLDGLPDPKYIEWLCLRLGEPLVSQTYLADLKRKLA